MLRKLNRITLLFVILTIAFFTFLFRSPNGQPEPLSQHGPAGSVPSYAVGESLSLAPDQCEAAFPGLNKEIENAVSIGPVQLKRLKDDIPGLVQGRIKNGKVHCPWWIGVYATLLTLDKVVYNISRSRELIACELVCDVYTKCC